MCRVGRLSLLLLLPPLGACLSVPGGDTGDAGIGGSAPVTDTGGQSGKDGQDGQGGAGRDAPAASDAGGPVVGLPLVVTDTFNNQGWFGDSGIMTVVHPGSTVVRQFAASEGLCESRMPGARGRCLEIIYTPPSTVPLPASGGPFIGVYALRSLRATHAETTPAARPGDPNWGLEPGLAVAPGATQISFFAGSMTGNQAVTFRAGTDKDSFVLPETTQTLQPSWKKVTLPLAGATYESGIFGAFAWVLKDTRMPARFFVDDIVWE